jgi:hypothetical protein
MCLSGRGWWAELVVAGTYVDELDGQWAMGHGQADEREYMAAK